MSWPVHFSPEAEGVLRDVSRSARAAIATAVEEVSRHGPSRIATDHLEGEWTGQLRAGDHVVTVAGREGDSRIVVVRIDLLDDHAASQAVDVLPLKLSTRRSLAGLLQGLDLDLRYTLRALRRAPLFTAAVIATLAVGFGGATALLDIVHTVYRGELPFGDGDRLVRLRNVNTSSAGEVRRYNLTPADFQLLRASNRSFTEVVAMGGRSLSLLGEGPAERVSAIGVSPRWTQTLQLRPMLGRTFTPDEEAAGSSAPVALISHALWQRRFNGDSAVLGHQLRHDGGILTVIGVMPPHINYPYDASVWTPWSFAPSAGGSSSLNVVGRLRDGATLQSAQADLERVHDQREASGLPVTATGFDVATVRADFIRDDARTLQALSAAVFFLLLLACMNVANLLVARFTTRRAELGVRAALGGKRGQQIRQMLLESLLLFAGGALGGMLLGHWLRQLLSMIVPDNFRTELGFVSTSVGSGVVALTMAGGLACGLAVGIIAAMRAVRTDPMTLVRQGGRGNVGAGDRRLFDVLVAAQLSFSLVLLVGATLLIGRFRQLSGANPGYDLAGVVTMRMTIDQQERYQRPETRHQLARALEERMATIPGVAAVGITTVNPLCCGDWGAPVEVEGRPAPPGAPAALVAHSYVSPGYFRAMSMAVRGSGFDATDGPGRSMTVVIDEEFARMFWPGEEAIGKRVRLARPDQPWRTVVGVVPVTAHEAEMRASWFLPYYQDPMGPSGDQLHVMIRQSAQVPMEQLREVVRQLDPALPVYGTASMESLQRERTAQDRLGAIVSAVFALFGLLLAGFSLYGLLSYSVELRRAEMGLRMALGASRGAILSMIFRQAGVRVVAGLLVGVGLALAVNQLLRGAVEGLGWIDWPTLLMLAGVLGAVAAAASVAPALRATRVDPIKALRA